MRRLTSAPFLAQPIEGGHGDGDAVADAPHVDHDFLRALRRRRPRQVRDHAAVPRVRRHSRCAWHRATASASAASPAVAVAGQAEQARHHEGHLRLLGAAETGDLHLDGGGREGVDGQPGLRRRPAASRPRTWPSTSAVRVFARVEDVLHRQHVGPQPRDERGDPGVDEAEPLAEGRARGRGEDALFQQAWRRPSVSMAP